MKLKVDRAEYLLEFALVVPIFLLIVLAALDVNSLLSANSALNEGVKLAARCLYATDGKCVDSSGSPPALFDVSLIKSTPVIFGDLFDYSGHGSWLQMQSQHFEPTRARVLDQVHISVQEQQGSSARALFPVRSSHDYNLRVLDFPYIEPRGVPVASNSMSESDLAFVYGSVGAARNTIYPPNETVSLASIDLRTIASAGSRDGGSVDFIIASPAGLDLSLPCYLSSELDQPVVDDSLHVAAKGLPTCGDNWPFSNNPTTTGNNELSRSTYATIWVTGSVSGTEVGASGSLSLSIENRRNGSRLADLGGKLIAASDTGNLIPRGNPIDRIAPMLRNERTQNGAGPYPEWRNYEAIKLPLNTPLRAVFTLTNNKDGASSAWRGASMYIYAPQYKFAHDRQENCAKPLPDSQIKRNFGCLDRFPSNSPTRKSLARASNNASVFDNQIPIGCQADRSGAQAASDSAVKQRNQFLNIFGTSDELIPTDFQISLKPDGSCPVRTTDSQCPSNAGVPTPPDKQGRITNPSPAETLCPSGQGDGQQILILYWTEAVQDTNPKAFDSVPSDCLDTTNHFPAWLANYPKLEPLPPPTQGAPFPIFPFPTQNPADSLNDPRYSCASIGTKDFDSLADWLPTTSLFKGHRTDLGCSWGTQLKEDALQNGLDPRAYFEPARANSGQVELAGTPDSCMSTRYGESNLQAPVYLGRYPAGAPADCTLPGQECTYSFAGFGGDDLGRPSLNQVKALQLALNEVQAAYPQAVPNCTGDHCLNLSFTNTDGELNVVGSLRVPVKLFMGKSVTLQRNVVKTLESEFVR